MAEMDIDGFVTSSMIVDGIDTSDGTPLHFFMFKAEVRGQEMTIGVAQEASAARTLRDELDRYIAQCDNDLDGVLKGFLEGDQQ